MEPLLQDLLRQMNFAVCEYRDDGQFVLICEPPGWFQKVWGSAARAGMKLQLSENAPFLDGFLMDAEKFWAAKEKGELSSGLWVQQTINHLEIPLEAMALRIAGKPILSIHSPQQDFQEKTRVLQVARDSLLVHEQLRKETQKKEILLHCIIHDLSQPLAALRGCLDILELEDGTPKIKQLVATGKQQAEQQESMIRDVLKAFSEDLKAEREAEQAAGSNPNLLQCAEATVTAFGAAFEAKGAAIRLDPRIDRSLAWIVKGEESRLMRIFANLVENALRYSPVHSVVTLGLEEDSLCVKAVVDDQGPGLPKEFKPSDTFKLFSTGKSGGGKAGLGLYFCRVTIERWGGAVGCESLPEGGTRFWFQLLKAQPSQKDADSKESGPAASRRIDVKKAEKSLRILLAEDEPVLRELTQALLTQKGHDVVAVGDGKAALRVWSSGQFDVLLVDDEMPGAGGTEVARKIRTEEKSSRKHQKILSLTGNSTKEDQKRLLDAGIDACLTKPFHVEDLYRALEFHPIGTTPAASLDSAGTFDPELLARVGGDAKLLRRMIVTFLKDCPKKMQRIEKAIAQQNAPELASAAHALKGLVAIFGAESAKHHAQDLVDMGRKDSLAAAKKMFETVKEEVANLEQKLRGYVAQANRGPSKTRKKGSGS